jgi:rhodanese-related sulfurtransferase
MNRAWSLGLVPVLSLLSACQSSVAPAPPAAQPAPALQSQFPAEQVHEISAAQLQEWMAARQPFTLIDVREDNEWQAGHAAAALHLSRWTLAARIGAAVPDKSARIVLYCLGGVRSAAATVSIQRIGYTNVFSLAGGFKSYQRAGLPVQAGPGRTSAANGERPATR